MNEFRLKDGSGQLKLKLDCFIGYRDDEVTIRLYDELSSQEFLTIDIPAVDFLQTFSNRRSRIPITGKFNCLNRVGKKMVMDKITIEMPPSTEYANRDETAYKLAKLQTPEGWICDAYFNSRDQWTYKDGKTYVTATIRKWVDGD